MWMLVKTKKTAVKKTVFKVNTGLQIKTWQQVHRKTGGGGCDAGRREQEWT